MGDLADLRAALAAIGEDGQSAYQLALRYAPATVLEEAPPAWFLRNRKPEAAAQLLCDYWQERVWLFGQERAFLPLVSTRVAEYNTRQANAAVVSALNEQDIEILETGSLQILPPDKNSRTVVFMDRSRLEGDQHMAVESRLRISFYLLTKALLEAEDPSAASDLVVVGMACRPPHSGYDWSFPRRFLKLPNYFPVRIVSIHVCASDSLVASAGRLVTGVLGAVLQMIGTFYGSMAHVHYPPPNEGQESLWKELRGTLSKKRLPEALGGRLTDGYFRHWLTRIRHAEELRYWTVDQRLERKRSTNALHSKQKRQRRRAEWDNLQAECDRLSQELQVKRAEEARLTELLRQANEWVALSTTSTSIEPLPSVLEAAGRTLAAATLAKVPVAWPEPLADASFASKLPLLTQWQDDINPSSSTGPVDLAPLAAWTSYVIPDEPPASTLPFSLADLEPTPLPPNANMVQTDDGQGVVVQEPKRMSFS